MRTPMRCLLLLFLCLSIGATRASGGAPDIAASLRALTTGSLEERIEAAEDADTLVGRLKSDPSGLSSEDLVARLIDAMGQETDDWVSRTMLEALIVEDNRSLSPLFRAAIESHSPNLRAIALRWYMIQDDPNALDDLEGLWDEGVPPWARSDLMDALVEQGSTRFNRDFIRLAVASDRAVRVRALAALGKMVDDDGLTVLMEASREPDRRLAATAIDSLTKWPDSEAALDAVLSAARSGAPARYDALKALASFPQERSGQRLIEVLRDPDSGSFHEVAAESLRDSDHPEATGALVKRLRLAFEADEESLANTILNVLSDRDDPEALPDLRMIAASLDPDGADRPPQSALLELIADLDPDASSVAGNHGFSVTLSCGLDVPDPDDPEVRHIVAPRGRATVRCWQRPGSAGESWDTARIPSGALFVPQDYFERNGETWMLAESPDGDDCWVPERLSARGAGAGAPRSATLHEIDLPAAALRTSLARKLLASEAIDSFDEEDEVVGVVIRMDPKDPRLVRWSDELLDLDIDLEEVMAIDEDPPNRGTADDPLPGAR